MAERSAGSIAKVTDIDVGNNTTARDEDYTGVIQVRELLMYNDAGLIDQGGVGAAEGMFAGVSEAGTGSDGSATQGATPTEDLKYQRRGFYNATVQSTDALADAANSFRLLEGGASPTLTITAHRGRKVFMTDGRTLDLDPDDPSAVLAGYIHKIVTVGGNAAGVATVLLDADWARAVMDAVLPVASENNRSVSVEDFDQRPVLAVSIDITATAPTIAEMDLIFRANRNFMTAGTNLTDVLVTHHADGGVTMTTAGADNDQGIMEPRTNPAGQTIWATGLNTAKRPRLKATIVPGAAITNVAFYCKLALTNALNVTTDDDQIGIRFDTDNSDANWQAFTSIADTDSGDSDTGVVVAASTEYRIMIDIDEGRVGRIYINEDLVFTSAALTSLATLLPIFGVQALAAPARALTIRPGVTREQNVA